jgi:hypothetical protein
VAGETHSGVIGRLVINVETGEVLFVAGQNVDAGGGTSPRQPINTHMAMADTNHRR